MADTTRREYTEHCQKPLRRKCLDGDPLTQFVMWFQKAVEDPRILTKDEMVLATIGVDGTPNARTVLFKGWDDRGLFFYTNKKSQKGQDIQFNDSVCAVVRWDALDWQVVIRGRAEELPRDKAKEAFRRRPRGAKLASWASHQSEPIPNRMFLEKRVAEMAENFIHVEDDDISCPTHWTGYRLVVEEMEFWQGGRDRLHDRFLYTKEEDGKWKTTRLAP